MKKIVPVVIISLFISFHVSAATPSLLQINSKDYGETSLSMRFDEIERNEKTSLIRHTYQELGTAVASSMFFMRAFYEIAKARGAEYFIILKEWKDPQGRQMFMAGFTNTKDADLKKEFGDQYSYEDEYGQKRIFIGVSQFKIIFENQGKDSATPIPESRFIGWPEPKIEIDMPGLTKSLMAECCFRGRVRSIQVGNFDGDPDTEIAVVPQTGVYLFDADKLKQKAKLDYAKPDGETLWFGMSPHLIAGKNGFKIAVLGNGGNLDDVGLLDQDGKELWEFKPYLTNGMVVDDSILGEPRFYVCDSEAIFKLDTNGKVIWKVTEHASYITLVRDEDGSDVAFATADPSLPVLKIWTSEGKLAQQIDLPMKPYGLEFVSTKGASGFVIKSGRQVAFVDRAGKPRFTYSYEDLPIVHGPTAALVRFTPQQPPFLAVQFLSGSATGKSVLSLFSLDGTHLYEEILKGGSALGIVPVKNENRDRLIVGEGINKLWAYEIALPDKSIQRRVEQTPVADVKR
jgi:hypothetical protein